MQNQWKDQGEMKNGKDPSNLVPIRPNPDMPESNRILYGSALAGGARNPTTGVAYSYYHLAHNLTFKGLKA
jgi:hypothetical protein